MNQCQFAQDIGCLADARGLNRPKVYQAIADMLTDNVGVHVCSNGDEVVAIWDVIASELECK